MNNFLTKSKMWIIIIILLISSMLNENIHAETNLQSIFRVRFDVGGQFYDYQNYHEVPYLHGGIDLCAPAGTNVITPVTGKVAINEYNISASARPHKFVYERRRFKKGTRSNTRYLEVAISIKDGTTWMFRHISPDSVPDQVFRCAEQQTEISAGTIIGKVAPWPHPVLPEKRSYDHIHLEITGPDGSFLNPANFVKTVKDYYPPVIHGLYAQKHGSDAAVLLNGNNQTINGQIDLVAAVTDRMNQSAYQHSVYKAAFSLFRLGSDKEQEKVLQKTVVNFDKLPIKGDRTQLSLTIYRDYIKTRGGRIQANGNHGPRFFLLNLTSGCVNNGYSPNNHLDTTSLANGRYQLMVEVADSAGNLRHTTVEFIIRN